MDSNNKNKTATPLTPNNSPSYEQLYILLKRATDCLKESNARISQLETDNKALVKRIEMLEAVGVSVNANGQVVQTYARK